MLADVRHLVSGSASSFRDLVVEASSRVQGARSVSRSSTSSSWGSDLSPAPGRGARGHRPERILPLTQVARAAPRVVKVKRKRKLKSRDASGSRCENFVPWVLDDTDGPQDLEEEERRGCLIAMPLGKENDRSVRVGNRMPPLPNLQNRANRQPMINLLLTVVRGTG